MIKSGQWEKIDEILQMIYASRDLEELQHGFLDGIGELVPYDQGAFCLIERIGGRYLPVRPVFHGFDPKIFDAYEKNCTGESYPAVIGRWLLTKAYRSSDPKNSLLHLDAAAGGGIIVSDLQKPAVEVILLRAASENRKPTALRPGTKSMSHRAGTKPMSHRAGTKQVICQGSPKPTASRPGPELTDNEMEILQVLAKHLEICFSRGLLTRDQKRTSVWLWVKAGLQNKGLTDTEAEIALHSANGFSADDISAIFEIAPSTVKKNFTRIYKKLGVKGRPAMVYKIQQMMDRLG